MPDQNEITCRKCNSNRVQKSSARDFDYLFVSLTSASAYRCKFCFKRFWVWSGGNSKTKIFLNWLILLALIVLTTLSIQWLFSSPIDTSQHQSDTSFQLTQSRGINLVDEDARRDLVTSFAFNEAQSLDENVTRIKVSATELKQKLAQAKLISQNSELSNQQQGLALSDIKVDPEEFRSLIKVDINYLIEQWRKAWQSGDSKAYLSFYHKRFRPTGSLSLPEWRKQRRARVIPSKKISLKLSNFDVTLDSDNQKATVIFDQEYQSKTFKDASRKQLILIKDIDWKIIAEQTIN